MELQKSPRRPRVLQGREVASVSRRKQEEFPTCFLAKALREGFVQCPPSETGSQTTSPSFFLIFRFCNFFGFISRMNVNIYTTNSSRHMRRRMKKLRQMHPHHKYPSYFAQTRRRPTQCIPFLYPTPKKQFLLSFFNINSNGRRGWNKFLRFLRYLRSFKTLWREAVASLTIFLVDLDLSSSSLKSPLTQRLVNLRPHRAFMDDCKLKVVKVVRRKVGIEVSQINRLCFRDEMFTAEIRMECRASRWLCTWNNYVVMIAKASAICFWSGVLSWGPWGLCTLKGRIKSDSTARLWIKAMASCGEQSFTRGICFVLGDPKGCHSKCFQRIRLEPLDFWFPRLMVFVEMNQEKYKSLATKVNVK